MKYIFTYIIPGRVQATRRDRAKLLPRPREVVQAAHLQAQGTETQGMWTFEKETRPSLMRKAPVCWD